MLHVITGPPCAGKSTYAQEHSNGGVVVDFDKLAQTFGAPVKHDAREPHRGVAFAARAAAVRKCIEGAQEFDSWIIHTSPTPAQMDAYRAARAELITVDPGINECLARCERDGRPEGTAARIRAWYEHNKKDGSKMETKIKSARLEMKDGGKVEGYISTFDRVPDSYGDIVAHGAFADTLAEWREKNARGVYLPLLYGHNTTDPFYNIGRFVELREDEKGLYGVAEFDPDNERAQYVRKLAQEGRIYQYSFAYAVLDAGPVELEGGGTANELRKLDIYEGSIVQIPANQYAEVVAVKDAGAAVEVKAGARNSKADTAELESVRGLAQNIIEVVSGLLDDAGPADDTEQEQPHEGEGADGDTGAGADRDAAAEKGAALLDYMTSF